MTAGPSAPQMKGVLRYLAGLWVPLIDLWLDIQSTSANYPARLFGSKLVLCFFRLNLSQEAMR
jgi:hypothetical protein